MVTGKSIHLHDGAYITRFDHGEYVITANHHDPKEATDRVYIDDVAAEKLVEFIKGKIAGQHVEL